MEEGDGDYVDTALREAEEEIGLDPSQAKVRYICCSLL